MKEFNQIKTALVYDKVNTWGGAERVLLALQQIFPQAPLYTSVYHPQSAPWAKVFHHIIPSFLQNFPLASTHDQLYVPLMPLAFESFNFDRYDLVVSVTSKEAKGVFTRPHTLHLNYCLTPTRYLWSDPGYDSYQHFNLLNKPVQFIKGPFLQYLRNWDFIAAQRPDRIATISQTSRQRIRKYYRRDAVIIPPPIDTNFFKPSSDSSPYQGEERWYHLKKNINSQQFSNETIKQYFLIVSRLTPYKKIDLAIKVFNQLKLPLIIAGTGPQLKSLKSIAKSNVTLIGHCQESQLLTLYQHCQALIMPQEEDFGLVSLEAQACGKPVIAYQKGGASETIIPNRTGILFKQQTSASLITAIRKFQKLVLNHIEGFNPRICRQQAEKYSLDRFRSQMKQWISSQLINHQKQSTLKRHN